jgi:hypothetical protein
MPQQSQAIQQALADPQMRAKQAHPITDVAASALDLVKDQPLLKLLGLIMGAGSAVREGPPPVPTNEPTGMRAPTTYEQIRNALGGVGEAVNQNPAVKLFGGPENAAQMLAMTVFHGSPYKFAAEPGAPFGRFKESAVGSGEGAAAYGHAPSGYWAQNPRTSRYYAKTLSPNKKGYVYKADLPDSAVGNMLDWDAPLSQQPHIRNVLDRLKIAVNEKPVVRWLQARTPQEQVFESADAARAFATSLEQRGFHPAVSDDSVLTGAGAYTKIVARIGSEEGASDLLREHGIPGIKYFDATSRSAGQGSRNVALFDPLATIIDRTPK